MRVKASVPRRSSCLNMRLIYKIFGLGLSALSNFLMRRSLCQSGVLGVESILVGPAVLQDRRERQRENDLW